MRQSPAPSLNPAGPISDGASCPCPLSAAPRASLPLAAVSSRRKAPSAGPRRRSFVEPLTSSCPLRSRLATDPLAKIGLVVRSLPCGSRRIDPRAPGFRQPRELGRPAPLRGADRWWAPLSPGGPALLGFRPLSSRLAGASASDAGLFALRVTLASDSYWRFASSATPRHRDAPSSTHITLRSPEPDELSPAGVSFESLVSATELANR